MKRYIKSASNLQVFVLDKSTRNDLSVGDIIANSDYDPDIKYVVTYVEPTYRGNIQIGARIGLEITYVSDTFLDKYPWMVVGKRTSDRLSEYYGWFVYKDPYNSAEL